MRTIRVPFIFLMLFFCIEANAQISGSTSVLLCQQSSYTYNDGSTHTNFTWTVAGGSIISAPAPASGTTYTLTVLWTTVGVNAGRIIFLDNYVTKGQPLYVTVTQGACPTFTKPTAFTAPSVPACGYQTLNYTGSIPSNALLFWQFNDPWGTSTATSGTRCSASQPGSYYMRFRSSCDPNCWGPASDPIVVASNTILSLPAPPPVSAISIKNYDCAAKMLTHTPSPANVTWYWETSYNGTAIQTVNSNTDFQASTNGPYYLRTRDSNGCWSPNLPATSFTLSSTTNPPAPNSLGYGVPFCDVDPVTLTTTGYPTGGSLLWYDNSSTTLLANGLSYTANYIEGNYTLKVYALSTAGCKSSTPATITFPVTKSCSPTRYYNNVEQTLYGRTQNGSTPVAGSSKEYYDGVSRLLQSQVLNITNNMVIASEPINNREGKPVLNTLPAPINSSSFSYQHKFATDDSGKKYNSDDFDLSDNPSVSGSVSNPKPVTNGGIGTLGWYYSSANNIEPLVATTNYPYARKYVTPGPNPVSTMSSSPGDVGKMGGGHNLSSTRTKFYKSEPALQRYFKLRKNFIPPSDDGTATKAGYWMFGGQNITVAPGTTYTFKVAGYSGSNPASLYVGSRSLGIDIVWPGPAVNSSILAGYAQVTFTVPSDCNDIYLGVLWNSGTSGGNTINILSSSITQTDATVVDTGLIGYKITTTNQDNVQTVDYIDAGGKSIASASIVSGVPDNWSYRYYNDLGQLVAEVAPNGVNMDPPQFVTTYKYDHLGRLVEKSSPDEGLTQYIYASDGKLRFSQNAKQRVANRFSYTNYDALGRLIESGEYVQGSSYFFEPQAGASGTPAANSVLNLIDDVGFVNLTHRNPSEQSACVDYYITEFDQPGSGLPSGRTQEFTRGRISKTENSVSSTWYSYNEFGEVVSTAQLFPNITGQPIKTVDYTYDYFGNISQIAYQQGVSGEAFYHHYLYDADQRLIEARTSTDGVVSTATSQAKYYYYLHGPLKRIELGTNLQGIDYVYNADGSLKLINNADPNLDPGSDGQSGSHSAFVPDVFGETLDYYSNDYTAASPTYNEGDLNAPGIQDHWGGLLKAARWHSAIDNHVPRAFAFTYNNVNWLDDAVFGNLTNSAGTYTFNSSGTYEENPGYLDKNGNISSMIRKGKLGNTTANYSYNYQANTNKLIQVSGGTNPINYTYNEIGQMTQQQEGTKGFNVVYNAQGKPSQINSTDGKTVETLGYDDRGFLTSRITNYTANNQTVSSNLLYVNDASGNPMATYSFDATSNTYKVIEFPVYGSGRIGLYKPNAYVGPGNGNNGVGAVTFYEVSDHLGNVRGVIGKNITMSPLRATMEDTGIADYTNPRVSERTIFKNIDATATRDANKNYTKSSSFTPPLVDNNPQYSSYLKWVDGQIGNDASVRSVGPAVNLKVEPGDKIDISVWDKFRNQSTNNPRPGIVPAMVSILAHDYVGAPGLPDLPTATQVFQDGVNWVTGTLGGNANELNTFPHAHLYYLVYDRTFNLDKSKSGSRPVTIAGRFETVDENLVPPPPFEQLVAPQISITEPGYVFIFVANETPSTDVWFDDLNVQLQRSSFVAGADYYPFGLAMEDRESTREYYRYGYQGQFAEKDTTTGWNNFQLRTYDPRIGRWLSADPNNQYVSPYLAMANVPNLSIDPDGGFSWGFTWGSLAESIGFKVAQAVASEPDHPRKWAAAAIEGALSSTVGKIGEEVEKSKMPEADVRGGGCEPWKFSHIFSYAHKLHYYAVDVPRAYKWEIIKASASGLADAVKPPEADERSEEVKDAISEFDLIRSNSVRGAGYRKNFTGTYAQVNIALDLPASQSLTRATRTLMGVSPTLSGGVVIKSAVHK